MKQFAVVLALLSAVLSGLLPAARAQSAAPPAKYAGKLSTDPAQYILDVQAMMASTNNAAARAAGTRLQELWGSRLTAGQKTNLVALSQTMLEKKFRPRPHFELLYGAIIGGTTGAVRLNDAQLDQYLDVLTQTLNKEKTTETEKFLTTSNQLLTTGYLYKSSFNGLKVLGGTISFAYSPIDAPESNLEFGVPAPKPEPAPEPKPAPKAAVKPAAKKPAPKPVPKKKANDGWDTGDMWTSPTGSGWGDDDGWGTPVKKAPAKKTAAKAPAKTAAKPVETVTAKDFDSSGFGGGGGFDAPSPAYSAYYPPPTRGAVLVIEDADLLMSTSGDSVVLHKVSGTAAPNSNRFVATAGTLDWTITGNPVSADLGGFDFDLSKPEFKAEPVTLTYAAVLDKPVKGAISYKSTRRKPGAADNGYPRFISLTNDAVLKTLGPNISYVGGLTLAGSRILSAALDGSVSRIVVSLDGKPKFRAASRAYVLSDTLITAARAAVTVYEGAKDSIYHPGVSLRYVKAKKLLKLDREDGMFKDTPYADSYHQLDIRAHQLSWVLDKPEIDFAVLSSKNNLTADFESKEFFTNTRYQQIKGYNNFHPLQLLVGYSQANGNRKTVNVSELAEFAHTSESNMRSSMGSLAGDGYVKWDARTGAVTILPKGYHYVAAGRGKKDFDHIAIKSLTGSGRNATLNLNTDELLVRGVDRFNFSDDTATVFVRPDSSIVRIQKGRNLNFGGTVVASAMRFKGRDFNFDYNGFYVDMQKIDSMVIRARAPKKAGKSKSETPRADFALTNGGKVSTGRLYINDPRNRSGRKQLSNYPSFDSKTGANVFFGKQDVLGGAYDSTMVFDIPPFKLDSLNNIGKSASGFDGVFKSGGILPNIKTKLSVQEDGSLGFVYDAPKEGFPMYKGRGKMTGKVKMDGKGLQIVGTVQYGAGTFASDDFVLYRDSVVAVGKSGTITAQKAKGVDIPKMALPAGYLMKWEVAQDSMYLTTPPKGDPIKLYANEATKTSHNFTGTALLTKTGAGGSGKLDGPQSYVKSPEMTFRADGYSARQATLAIKSAEANKPALTANGVAMEYDLKKGTADFGSEEGSKSSIDLPYSQFKTTLSGGHWDFKKKRVELSRPAADADKKTYFYSTNPAQGLRFEAASATYDLAKYSLDVRGVPHIASIDAWIVPDSGHVSVLAKGQLKPLKNAGVLLDSLAKFHRLYKGNIKVQSRMAFSGDALYSFKTTRDSFAIRFANFEADSSAFAASRKNRRDEDEAGPSVATAAVGSVDAKSNFQLAPRIGFRGDVALNSQRRGLVFDGQVQLQFGKSRGAAEWFAVKDSIDPKNISLSLRNVKAEDGTPLVTGLFMSDQSNKVYPLYVSAQPDANDVSIFAVDGKLRYDDRKGRFTIARHDADDPAIYEGAVMTYEDATGQLGFRGPMKFVKPKKDFSMVGSGVGTANPDSARYDVDVLMGLDINLPGKAVDAMAKELAFVTKQSPEAQDGSTNELYKLGEFIGSKGVEAYTASRGVLEPILKLSPKLSHTILLSRVNLKWDDKRRAWYSVGQIGLAGVGKTPLNALIGGYIEIKRDNGADWMEMYLEAEPQVWYYFKYVNGKLLAKAQNEDFDAAIGGKSKGDFETATDYGVYLGEYSEVEAFKLHFKRDYLGLSGKELQARPAPPPRAVEPPSDADNGNDRKSRKKKKGDDAFGDADSGSFPPPAAPEPEPGGKKRKKDKNDPFGGGDDGPAPAPATTPTPPPAAREKAKETVPVQDTPPPAAVTEPPSDETLSPKEQEKAAKQAAKEAEKAAKEEEKRKKEEEKRKKDAANDPFGGS